MDDREREIRKDISRGYSPTEAAARSSYGLNNTQSIALGRQIKDRMESESNKRIINTMFTPSPSSSGGSSDGAGHFFLLLLGVMFFVPLIKGVLGIAIVVMMLIGFIVAVRDGRWARLLLETVFIIAVFAPIIYFARGGSEASAIPNIWFLDFPALATGRPAADAALFGLLFALLVTGMPNIREMLFDKIGALFVVPWMRIFMVLGERPFVMLFVGFVLILPFFAGPIYAAWMIDDLTWQLYIPLGYVFLLSTLSLISLVIATRSREAFLQAQWVAHPLSTMKEYNRPLLKQFVRSSDLGEKYYLAKNLQSTQMRVGAGPSIFMQNGTAAYDISRARQKHKDLIAKYPPDKWDVVGPLIELLDSVETYAEKKVLARAIKSHSAQA